MASDAGFVQHVCDQVRDAGAVTFRRMFGEYAVYVDERVVALVCDNRLFLKPTAAGRALLHAPVEGAPYPGARPHLVLDDHLDDSDLLSALFRATRAAVPAPKPKKPRASRGGTKRKQRKDAEPR
jgi:TfoX/Sxy family transcriptional regulator of competence genes